MDGRRDGGIVGCGKTPENVTMGSGSMKMQGIPCSLGRRHSQDFTVDISADARADLTLNLLQIDLDDLSNLIIFQNEGFRRFDEVIFEYLSKGPPRDPNNRFSFSELQTGVRTANNLLKIGGKIDFINGNSTYRGIVTGIMGSMKYRNIADKLENGHMRCVGTKSRN